MHCVDEQEKCEFSEQLMATVCVKAVLELIVFGMNLYELALDNASGKSWRKKTI